jgi:hypothetical protein
MQRCSSKNRKEEIQYKWIIERSIMSININSRGRGKKQINVFRENKKNMNSLKQNEETIRGTIK